MKTIKTFFVLAFIFAIASVGNAQDAKANLRNFGPKPKNASFKVYGECSMCEHRIENALKIDGIKSATWDVDSKILSVQYFLTDIITGESKIQQLVAAAGHDTEKRHAPDNVYEKLPGCCHYQRKSS